MAQIKDNGNSWIVETQEEKQISITKNITKEEVENRLDDILSAHNM